MERRARLFGLDLERNLQFNVRPTAEQLASLFGWDAQDVVDVTAAEISAAETDDREEALSRGSCD